MRVLPACMSVYRMKAWCLWRSEKSVGFLGTGVRDCCEQACGVLRIKPGFSRRAAHSFSHRAFLQPHCLLQ